MKNQSIRNQFNQLEICFWLQKINWLFLRNNQLFISTVLKIKAKANWKSVRIKRLTHNVNNGSLFTRSYIHSSATTENSLSNQTLITNNTPKWWSWTLQEHTPPLANTTQFSQPLKLHNTNSHRITVIKKERNGIHLDTIKDLCTVNTEQSYSTLENDPKLFEILKTYLNDFS